MATGTRKTTLMFMAHPELKGELLMDRSYSTQVSATLAPCRQGEQRGDNDLGCHLPVTRVVSPAG
jgi:hypothetical protein